MKPLLAALVVVSVPTVADAATIRCSFTEPFFTISFDTADGKVTFLSPDEFDAETGQPVPKVLAENAKLVREEVWQDVQTFYLKAGEETLVTLKLTGNGSDGMSDFVFPFEGSHGQNVGGCETDKAQAFDLYEIYQDFGIQP